MRNVAQFLCVQYAFWTLSLACIKMYNSSLRFWQNMLIFDLSYDAIG